MDEPTRVQMKIQCYHLASDAVRQQGGGHKEAMESARELYAWATSADDKAPTPTLKAA